MSFQELLVLLTLTAALAYLAWRSGRAWRGRRSGCGGCGGGCTTPGARPGAQALIPREKLTLRLRPPR